MSWTFAAVRIGMPRHEIAETLPADCTFHCLRPGQPGQPLGFLDREPRSPWENVAKMADSWLTRLPGADCRECPLTELGPDIIVVDARLSRSEERARLAARSTEHLHHAIARIREAGYATELSSVSPRHRPSLGLRLVNYNSISQRQLETLRVAEALGYYKPGSGVTVDDVAAAVGLSRSTVHEHLAKALSVVVSESLAALQNGASENVGDAEDHHHGTP